MQLFRSPRSSGSPGESRCSALPRWLALRVVALAALGCSSPSSTAATPSATSAAVAGASPRPPPEPAPSDTLVDIPADPREGALAEAASFLLTKQHVVQHPIDDELSRQAFEKFIEELDGAKVLLLDWDVKALSKYERHMDDELLAGDLVLGRKGAAMVAQRRKVVASMVAELLAQPMNFATVEEIETDPKKRAFCKTEAELRERWRGVLKLQLLERVQQMEELLAAKTKTDGPQKPLDEAAARALASIPTTPEGRAEKARKELATRFETRFLRLATLEPLEPAGIFLNAVAATFDPHTQYLAPSDKANFDIALSGKLEGIGAALREQDHYIVVEELIPGGASSQQGKLGAGDVILAVAQAGQDAVDVVDMPIDKVVKMIRGPKATVVILTVKKPDGTIETISIKRDVIKIEATYARGALLDLGPKGDAVGYIYLPGFYGDIGSGPVRSGERNATGDVRALLLAFQKKRVGRVIIDLRGNGGGLLSHARDISGLFIDKGPVVQTRDAEGTVEVLADEDPGIAFSGDVVVMVDRFSASASEILAGALQDYERAVIVGTGPTHGKGTVQAVVDLDRLKRAPGGEPLGVFKVTIEQYFRVNGASVQLRGVTPDIVLADPSAFVESGERTLFHPIPSSTVAPAKFRPRAHAWTVSGLQGLSRSRVGQHPTFAKVEAFGRLVTTLRDQTKEPLEEKAWRAKKAQNKAALDAADPKLSDQKPLFEVELLSDAATAPAAASTDKAVKKTLDAWRDGLARDPWVEEALHVLDDMAKKP